MNYRFAQPTRTQRQHIARWTPEFQFPFADVPFFDQVTGKYGGRLDACRRSFTCPKIFEVNSENEYWAKGGSMLTTDGQGHDLDLSTTPNVRYYQLSSLPHGAGTAAGICRQPQNPLVPDPVLRALLVDLDQWVTSGQRPPDNRVPSFAGNTLAPSLPQSGMGFPNIPNPSTTLPVTRFVAYNGILHTGDLWNFDKGDGLDADSIEFGLLSDQVNAIRALFSGRNLQVFTSGAEWIVTGSPLTPTNIQLDRQTVNSHFKLSDTTLQLGLGYRQRLSNGEPGHYAGWTALLKWSGPKDHKE